MIDGLTLGAYALEPAAEKLAGREDEWYGKLAVIEGAHGLEIPYRGGLHRDGSERLAELLPKGWHVVITMLPPTMAGLRANAAYGLSSVDEEGRATAVADVIAALDEARRLSDSTGMDTVRAIYLTSAPRGTGNAAALARSLEELGLEVGEVPLLVEHCDAWHDDRPVEKGFLSLDAEIEAVLAARRHTDAIIGQAVNWGRSAIDGRSATEARRHLDALLSAGTLSALSFSGASALGGELGGPWADAHNPIDTVDPSSLLNSGEIEIALTPEVLAPLVSLGVKVQDPRKSDDFDEHLSPLVATVDAVRARLEQVSA